MRPVAFETTPPFSLHRRAPGKAGLGDAERRRTAALLQLELNQDPSPVRLHLRAGEDQQVADIVTEDIQVGAFRVNDLISSSVRVRTATWPRALAIVERSSASPGYQMLSVPCPACSGRAMRG